MRLAIQSWRRAGISLATGMALTLGAVPAEAARFVITYTGTVYNSDNQTGEFGTTDSLDGMTFEARYILTLPTPGAFVLKEPNVHWVSGGTGLYCCNAFPTNPIRGKLTINGVSERYGYATTYGGSAQFVQDIDFYQIAHNVLDYTYDGTHYLSTSLNNGFFNILEAYGPTADLTKPLSFSARDFDQVYGAFSITAYTRPRIDETGLYDRYVRGRLFGTSLTVAAIPEPASWAMMIAGFGFVGGAMRSAKGRQSRLRRAT